MGKADLTKLIEYGEVKLEKLKEIRSLTEQQKDAIDREDFETLNRLIAEKQKVIDFIDRCDSAFQEEMERLKEEMGISSLSMLKDIQGTGGETGKLVGVVGEIVNSIRDIQALEKQNHLKLLKGMGQVKEKLRKVRQGKKGLAGYNPGRGTEFGSFIDKRK